MSRKRPRAPRCRPSAALSHGTGEGGGRGRSMQRRGGSSSSYTLVLQSVAAWRGPSLPHRQSRGSRATTVLHHSPSGRPLPGPSPRGGTLVESSILARPRARRVEGVTPRLTRARVCGALRDWGPALILTPVRDRLDPRGHREAVRRRDAVSRHPNCPNSSLIASTSTFLPPTTTIAAHQPCSPES